MLNNLPFHIREKTMKTGNDWVFLLLTLSTEHPELAEHCEWNKLTCEDWTWLLVSMPTSINEYLINCPWDQLDEEQVYDIVYYKPEYAHYVNWGILSRLKIETLTKTHPELIHYRLLFM